MDKSPDAFRTISEVADWLGVQAHVLRFWESKFPQIRPIKRAGGRRYYRPQDMALLGGIKTMLHDQGLTVKGVQKALRDQGVEHVAGLSPPLDGGLGDIVEHGAAAPAEPPKVVPFDGRARAFGGAPKPAPPPQADSPTTPPEPEPPAPEATPETAPEPVSPAAPDTGSEAAPEPAPQSLPSFLKRPLDAAPAEPSPPAATSPEDTPETEPAASSETTPVPSAGTPEPAAAPRPRVIDAPDPPEDETALPARPGLLTRLARTDRLTPEQAERIAPLVAALRGWVARVEQAGRH